MACPEYMYDSPVELYARAGGIGGDSSDRPPVYKAIGIGLAIGSGVFIGSSFALKKYGLIKANEKYNEVAGEGYGYLKNVWWWTGMILMIIGEICNFVAYAFTDAILVTPLGALSVVIATVLSAIFLKERLSMVGKVACFLCIVGSVVIVMNAPESSSVSNIQEMQEFVVSPGFLSYAGVIIVGAIVAAFWAGPKWGKKNMLVYISICSWIGGLSVVATQGLGAAIVAQAGGEQQFNQWFLWVLFVFVIATLLTEIIYLNKALNLFNAAMVTPTYYVYFTSTTIVTSAVLFRGFKGTAASIVTVVLGFLTICAGVVLLQLSKSAKDVPDTAVFKGDLDQIQTIAEQEEPETEPRADAIRGTAAIVRRISVARQKREMDELKRLHDEKMQEQLEVVSEEAPQYEWDGLRRRRTTLGSNSLRSSGWVPPERSPHPPLGHTHFLSDEELQERTSTPRLLSGIAGSIRGRSRTVGTADLHGEKVRSPMQPVPLTEISVPRPPRSADDAVFDAASRHTATSDRSRRSRGLPSEVRMELQAPTPSPGTKRHFSFQNVFKWPHSGEPSPSAAERPLRPGPSPSVRGATEEERLGLVKGDSRSLPALPRYDEVPEEHEDDLGDPEKRGPMSDTALDQDTRYGRGITPSPPRPSRQNTPREQSEVELYESSRDRWNQSRNRSRTPSSTGVPPSRGQASERSGSRPGGSSGGGGGGAFL